MAPHLFQCDKCPWGRHCTKDNPSPKKDRWHIKLKGFSYYKTDYCLLNQTDNTAHEIVKLYNYFDKGSFMVSGTIMEQPIVYRRCMELLQGILNHAKERPENSS